MIDFVNESALGPIGTADDAVAQIERLSKQSNTVWPTMPWPRSSG